MYVKKSVQLNCYKRCVNPKAHTYTFSTCFVFSFWYSEERNYKENYTLRNAKDFLVFLENVMYRISCHWTCPSICIICIFRISIVFTRAKHGCQCQIVTFWTSVSILYAVTTLFLFTCEAWDCAPFLSLHSRDFVMAVTREHMEATAFWASEAAASEQATLVD